MANQSEASGVHFNDFVPLPFRILFIIQLGVYLWYSIIYLCTYCSRLNILELLNLSYSSHNYTQLDRRLPSTGEYETTLAAERIENQLLLKGVWTTLRSITLYNFVGYCLYLVIQLKYDDPEQENQNAIVSFLYKMIPVVVFLYIFFKVFYQSGSKTTSKSIGQYRVYTTIKRILLGRINSTTMRTNDILISDTLTSYGKVINDFGLFVWTNYYTSESPYNIKLEFIILCIPTFIRIKQCWYEYSSTKNMLHFLNMVKYTTAIGPLIIKLLIKMTLQTLSPDNNEQLKENEVLVRLTKLNAWWYFCSVLNSTYTFIWDVKMDWGFGLFDIFFKSNKLGNYTLLRPSHQLIYGNIFGYYCVILIDFILRFLWIFRLFITNEVENRFMVNKLGAFLFGSDSFSLGYVVVEVLEIFRRWLWCFIKLESDWVKLQETINPDDIEMTNIDKRDI
ncbi:unnamed protein product [Debaryomyces tyrocola]|nr:unnamed protein product [Debaryomyces tyrocola]